MTTANVVTNNVVKTKVFSTKMDKISSFFYKKATDKYAKLWFSLFSHWRVDGTAGSRRGR